MTWRYLAYDLVTEEFITELNVSNWSSTDELNGAGTFSTTISVDAQTEHLAVQSAEAFLDDDDNVFLDDDDNVFLDDVATVAVERARDTSQLVGSTPAKTLIVAERNGVPEFAGIPWRRRYDAAQRTVTLAGADMSSFFDHLKPAADYTPAGVDQLTIFATLAARGAEIGIVVHGETSGRTRSRTYLRLANKKPGENMRELAAVIDGFDFDFRVEYVNDEPVRTQRLFYPRRGRPVASSNIRFRVPGNAAIVTVDEDATKIAAEVVGFGAGEGESLLESSAASTELIAAGYPSYGATVSHKDVSVRATLDEHVAAELRDRSVANKETFVLQVDPSNLGHPYGSWTLGDDAYLIIEDDPRFPAQSDGTPGLVTSRRIVSHTWTVTGTMEQLEVGLDLLTAVRGISTAGAGIDPDVDRRIRSLEGV
jgi:hypothetical protein